MADENPTLAEVVLSNEMPESGKIHKDEGGNVVIGVPLVNLDVEMPRVGQ